MAASPSRARVAGSGDLGAGVVDESGHGGHAADDDAGVDFQYADIGMVRPDLGENARGREKERKGLREDEDGGGVPGDVARGEKLGAVV